MHTFLERKGKTSRQGKVIRICLALFLLCFMATEALPAERSLTFGSYAKHWSGDHVEGVDNRLIALEYNHLTLAWFRNSYGKETAFIGYGWHSDRYFLYESSIWTRANLYAGVLFGYGSKHPVNFGIASPGVYPTASLGYKQYSLEVSVMPTLWWVSFKVEF